MSDETRLRFTREGAVKAGPLDDETRGALAQSALAYVDANAAALVEGLPPILKGDDAQFLLDYVRFHHDGEDIEFEDEDDEEDDEE